MNFPESPDASLKVGIVTVTYNSRAVLEDFFLSLQAQSYTNYMLYIVDSASTDDTVAYAAARLPRRARLLPSEVNLGFAAGTNLGIKAAFADGCHAILVLNNDVVLDPDMIYRLVEGMDRYGCEMTTPLMYFHQPGDRIWAAGGVLRRLLGYLHLHRGMGQKDHGQFSQPARVSFAPLCCVLVQKQVFDRVGLLDENYFTYTEDADFMYNCLKMDITLWYVPDAKLWHKVSSLTGGLSAFTIHYCVRGRIYFLHKNLNSLAAWGWTCAYLAYFPVQFLFRRLSWRTMELKYRAAVEGYALYRKRRSRRSTNDVTAVAG
jgi:hypothetical protein